ncbi:unnamed protein product [Closterium sp. NIES-65]|nr:unnamed protein product [Closterium sp. NIES-65]
MATSYRPRLHTPYRNSFLPYSTPCSVVLLLCLLVPTVTSLAPKPKRDLCDLSNGAWIRSPKRFPRYTTVAGRPKSCPFARSSYACERNNRPDLRYREYRWQPFDCPISYFSVSGFRFLMRDRRMLLVGDSMMSNLFEALLCSISSAGYEGQPFRRKTKGDFSIKGVHFPAFSFSLEYYFSPYIVRTSRRSIHNKATGKDAIKGGHGFDVYVDEMDPVLERVLASYSAVVFHSGVWWLQNVPRRTVPNNFYANGAQRNLSNIAAHTWALSTVLSFVKKIDYSGVPFFLSFSPKHAGAGQTQPGVEQSDGAAWVGACGARMPASRTFVHSRGKAAQAKRGSAADGRDLLVLEVVGGPCCPATIAVTASSSRVGRVKTCQIPLKEDSVSEKHACVSWDAADRSWRVVDLGSSNGTSLNGIHLPEGRERPLSDGDEIRFGPFTIVRVHIRPSPHHGSTVRDMLQQQMEWRLCRLEEQAATMEEQMRQDLATLKTI